jgi:predicted nucleic acid-binding protein
MKIYLDACCLNRPFDDQSQNRIRMESEAILIILYRFFNREWEWVGSEALDIEIEETPNIEKKYYLMRLASFVKESVKIQENIASRANELTKIGFKSFDAMHIACSESASTDIFLTTDDKLIKLAKKNKDKITDYNFF